MKNPKTPRLTEFQKSQIRGGNPESNNPVFHPKRLISLWEMNKILTEQFLNAWIGFRSEFLKAAENKVRPLSVISVNNRRALIRSVDEMHGQCCSLGFETSKKCCRELLKQLTDPAWHWDALRWEANIRAQPEPPIPKEIPLQTFQQIYAQLRLIYNFLREEMEAVGLVVIKSEKVRFLEKNDLFGEKVKVASSAEINAEIRAAGNCLAADLNTAAVFHLMRVVEHGMRALAPQIKVKMSRRQIAMATWSKIIEAMETEIKNSQSGAKSPRPLKPGQLKLYRGLLLDINAFKDLWRNDVMHARGNYDGAEAEGVFNHVKHFTELLADNIPLK